MVLSRLGAFLNSIQRRLLFIRHRCICVPAMGKIQQVEVAKEIVDGGVGREDLSQVPVLPGSRKSIQRVRKKW